MTTDELTTEELAWLMEWRRLKALKPKYPVAVMFYPDEPPEGTAAMVLPPK